MNTLLIIGLIAFGLGLLVIVGALFAILRAPQAPRTAAPARSRTESRPAAPKPAPAPEPAPRPAPAEPQPPPEPAPVPRLEPAQLPEEEESEEHLNTGVLNARDFDNLEDLMAAADKLTRKRDGE